MGLHGSPESKAKSANLVKLAKSIGLNEVFDLITLDAQQKLFGWISMSSKYRVVIFYRLCWNEVYIIRLKEVK